MRRYLLDTGVAADYIYEREGVPARLHELTLRGIRVGTALPVIGELFAGVEFSSTRAKNLLRLKRRIDDLIPWPFDRGAAEEFGRIWAYLRRTGRPMQQNDIQIAAIAISLGGTVLVTKDSDFAAIPGLAIEDWLKP